MAEKLENWVITSQTYEQFRKDALPARLTLYEKIAKPFGKIGLAPKGVQAEQMQANLETCHLTITPQDAFSFAIFAPLTIAVVLILINIILLNSIFLTVSLLFMAIAAIILLQKIPAYIALKWKMNASSQMVLCIFYIVTYMRHTSNLERALEFASQHLTPPLSLDLRKVVWDVETEKYNQIQDSMEQYLKKWQDDMPSFCEAIHLIESSLFETSEDRRLSLLDKSLETILDETYERMLHYAQSLKSPIQTLHMLGIILPILGMVILPLVVSFMENVKWWHLAIMYNIILPVIVYLMGKNILTKRPSGYGTTDITLQQPSLKKYEGIYLKIGKQGITINPIYLSVFVFAIILFISIIPLLIHLMNPQFDFAIGGLKFLDYRNATKTGQMIGPYGPGATVLSLLFPLSFAIGLGLYYKLKSQNVVKIREQTKKIEGEFSNSLFQLGNRLGDGLPAEIAFSKMAESGADTPTTQFFKTASENIRKLGMDVEDAIFDKEHGASTYFPSPVIASSMRVFIEGIRKGPLIAAQALMNIARYIKEMHRVDERLKDLLAEILSDMSSQINFLTPAIAAIVVGITSMITAILGALKISMNTIATQEGGGMGNYGALLDLFGDSIPTYYFQIVIGLYVVQIIYILTVLSVGISEGNDKFGEEYSLGKNLLKSPALYAALSFLVIIIFNIIAVSVIQSSVGVI